MLNTNIKNYSGVGQINNDWVASGTCLYVVRNGICFARFDMHLKTITSNRTLLISGFPEPKMNTLATISQWSSQTYTSASVEIIKPGDLICNACPDQYLAGYLVYPVN